MVSMKRAGIVATAVAALIGMAAVGNAAHAATTPGSTGDSGIGYQSAVLLSGVPTCDTATGKVDVAWTYTYTTDALDLTVNILSASSGGITTGPRSLAAQATPVSRVLTITGTTAQATAGTTLTQAVAYSVTRTGLAAPINNSLTATVDTGACVQVTTTTTVAPTTTTTIAATTTTTAAPVVTTAAPVVTTTAAPVNTTAKATTTTAKAVVLGTTALPATGSNTNILLAMAAAFGVIGATLLSIDKKRARA